MLSREIFHYLTHQKKFRANNTTNNEKKQPEKLWTFEQLWIRQYFDFGDTISMHAASFFACHTCKLKSRYLRSHSSRMWGLNWFVLICVCRKMQLFWNKPCCYASDAQNISESSLKLYWRFSGTIFLNTSMFSIVTAYAVWIRQVSPILQLFSNLVNASEEDIFQL